MNSVNFPRRGRDAREIDSQEVAPCGAGSDPGGKPSSGLRLPNANTYSYTYANTYANTYSHSYSNTDT